MENAVFIELLRRSCEVHYFRTPQGNEIDFHAVDPDGRVQLIQVCADASDAETFNREIRALAEIPQLLPHSKPLLITLDPLPQGTPVPDGIEVTTARPWFLHSPDH